MTIINIRGTSGAGKSTLVRRIMAHYPKHQPTFVTDQKRPIYLDLMDIDDVTRARTIGHYETACAGLDTLGKARRGGDWVYGAVREAHAAGLHVLFEGLVASTEGARARALAQDGFPLIVYLLNTPLEECLAGVRARRAEAGKVPEFNVENTAKRVRALQTLTTNMAAAGVDVRVMGREAAYTDIKRELGL